MKRLTSHLVAKLLSPKGESHLAQKTPVLFGKGVGLFPDIAKEIGVALKKPHNCAILGVIKHPRVNRVHGHPSIDCLICEFFCLPQVFEGLASLCVCEVFEFGVKLCLTQG